MSQTCVQLLPGEIEMRPRERTSRQPQRLPLGGIRPEEEDLVRIVLGLRPQSTTQVYRFQLDAQNAPKPAGFSRVTAIRES
jgi:hypothetical protein